MNLLLPLVSAVHGARSVIDIELENDAYIRVGRKGIFAHEISTSVQIDEEGKMYHIKIGSISIDIDCSQPFDHLIQELITKPGIKSANIVTFSPNERCQNKIDKFNETHLPLEEKIPLCRRLCSSLQKYKEEGSDLAIQNIPWLQNLLGYALMMLSEESKENEDPTNLLREAIQRFENSIELGYSSISAINDLLTAQIALKMRLATSSEGPAAAIPHLREALQLVTRYSENDLLIGNNFLPDIQTALAHSLGNLACETAEKAEKIALLREVVKLLEASAGAGNQRAKEDLPVMQNSLGFELVSLSSEPAEKIVLLKEAIQLFNKSTYAYAKENLSIAQYKLGSALVTLSEESVEKITLLRKAVKWLKASANTNYQRAREDLPVVQDSLAVTLLNMSEGAEEEISLLSEVIQLSIESDSVIARENFRRACSRLIVLIANSTSTAAAA